MSIVRSMWLSKRGPHSTGLVESYAVKMGANMASRVERKDFAKYLVEARSWESDKVRSQEISKRTAWTVAIVASILAIVSVVTVALLTPVQRVEAYVVRVDSSTGQVNVVRPLSNGDTTYDEAINKYFTQWYVRWREGFIQERAPEFYNNVGILSSSAEQARYLKQYDPSSQASPLNVYKNFGRSVITIKSTVLDKPGVARIQFTKEEDWGGRNQKTSQWSAMVFYRFSGAPMSEKDREINPLGFQVLNYTVAEDKSLSNEPVAGNTKVLPVPEIAPTLQPRQAQMVANPTITVPAIAPPQPNQISAPQSASGQSVVSVLPGAPRSTASSSTVQGGMSGATVNAVVPVDKTSTADSSKSTAKTIKQE